MRDKILNVMLSFMKYTNKCMQIKYALSYINGHLHVSFTFATTVRVLYKITNKA